MDNLGSSKATFSHLDLSFENDATGLPDHSILHIDNGGGKTTWLSLFFTLLKPRQDHFIQTIQKKNHRFEDYVKDEPGLVLAEFVPINEQDVSTRILGQYIYKRGSDIKRHYFRLSGIRDNDSSFQMVPSIGRGTLHSVDDINKFLTESGKCTATTVQSDWMDMIQEDLKMDEALIDAQINFCRTEGGISEFANFEKEEDFLKRFFSMTVRDGQEIIDNDYRSVIYDVIENHQDLPNLRREVSILVDIRNSIKTFADQADQFTSANEKYEELQEELGGYRTFLIDEVKRLVDQQSNMITEDKEAKKSHKDLKVDIAKAKTKLNMLDLLLLEIKKNTKLEEELALANGIKKIKMKKSIFRAASPLIEYRILHQEMKQKEKIVNECSKGADDITSIISDLWMHYAEILNRMIKQNLSLIKDENSKIKECEGKLKHHESEITQFEKEQKEKTREHMQATNFIEAHAREYQNLIKDGYLDEFEKLDSKIASTERDLDREGMKATDYESKIKEQTNIIKDKRIKTKGVTGQISSAEKEKAEPFNQLKTAKSETAVMISEVAKFRKLNESDINLYSEEHKRFIDQQIITSEDYIKTLGRDIFRVEMELDLIQSGDGTIVDSDVVKVKEQLEELNVRTIYASSYLCDQFNEDTDRVAEVVKSDPARFMGLMVYQDEDIAKAQGLIGQLKGIRKPVVISSVSIDPIDQDDDLLVIEPSTNVLYSKVKTAEYKKTLEVELQELKEKSEKANALLISARSLLGNLMSFYNKYSENTIKGYEQEVDRLEKKIIALTNERETLESELEKLEEKQEQNRVFLSECLKKSSKLDRHLTALLRFKNEFDSKLGENKEKRRFCVDRLKMIEESILDKKSVILMLTNSIANHKDAIQKEELKLSTARKFFNRTQIQESSLANYSFKEDLLVMSSEQLLVQIKSAEKDKERMLSESGYKAAKSDLEDLKNKCANIKTRVEKIMSDIEREYEDVETKYTVSLESLEKQIEGLNYDDINEREKIADEKHLALSSQKANIERDISDLESKINDLRDNYFDEDVFEELSAFKTEGLLKIQREETEKEHSNKIIKMREIESILQTLTNKMSVAKEHLNRYEIMQNTIDHMYEDTGRSYKARYIDVQNSSILKDDLIRRNHSLKKVRDKTSEAMKVTFINFKDQVNKEEIRKNPIYARIINQSLEEMIDSYKDALIAIEELIKVNDHIIETADSDIRHAVNTLENKVAFGLRKLKNAMSQRVPECGESYSGKLILKVQSNGEKLFRMAQNNELHQYLTTYIEHCIEENVKPVYMMTESITHVVRTAGINQDGRLGIMILQISNSGSDYYRIDDIKSSGGERLTTALLLYIIIGSVSGSLGFSGGFLLADNIFGTCNKASFIGVQLKVAKELNFQIISTTGHHQKGFMSQYPNILSIVPSIKADESGNIITQSCLTKGVFDETRFIG